MRELVFALEYRPERDRVSDVLADHPDARVRSLSLHASEERLWRVDHATGPPEALDAIEAAFLAADYYADCLATDGCDATQTTRVLDRTDDALVLYSDWERTPDCASVPHIARDHLGDGALFETRHEGRHYTWRVVHSGAGDVPAFFEALEAAVGDSARTEVLRTTDAAGASGSGGGLPPEQTAALRAAVEHGYYETPREVDATDLAAHLDVPRSTLTYRLRRAERHLARQYVADEGVSDHRADTLEHSN